MQSFEWDDAKAEANFAKHGVSFDEAATVFADWGSVDRYDREHSINEDRFIIIAESESGRVLIVVYTYRGEDTIRIISARTATTYERRIYEEENQRRGR